MTLTKLLGSHNQKSGPRDAGDPRGVCTVSKWAPLKYKAILVARETNPVLLAIERFLIQSMPSPRNGKLNVDQIKSI